MRREPTKISGITLLNKILELRPHNYPEIKWPLSDYNHRTSEIVRFKQINCLIKIFVPEIYSPTDLKESIDALLNGFFISKRKKETYNDLFLIMDKTITSSHIFSGIERVDDWGAYELRFNFEELLRYKIKINELINFNAGIAEISYPYCYSAILSDNISKSIQYDLLDDFLCTVIDPEKRVFSRDQLIEVHNYPSEDVYDLEIEEW